MILLDGYSLFYNKQMNRIYINLPQTVFTTTNTIEPVADRKVDVSDTELAAVLGLVTQIFKKEDGKNDS